MIGKRKRLVRVAAIGLSAALCCLSVLSGSRPFAPASGSAQEISGAQLFAQNCARCHGQDGEGGRGPNLLSEKRRAKWGNSNDKIVAKITKGGFIMPSFKKKLSPTQITAIAEFVRSMK